MQEFLLFFIGVILAFLFVAWLWHYGFSQKVVKIEGHKIRLLRWRAKDIVDQLDSFLCLVVLDGNYEVDKSDHLSKDFGQFHYLITNKKTGQTNFLTFYYGQFKRIYKIEGIVNYVGDNEKRFSASYYQISSWPIKEMIKELC